MAIHVRVHNFINGKNTQTRVEFHIRANEVESKSLNVSSSQISDNFFVSAQLLTLLSFPAPKITLKAGLYLVWVADPAITAMWGERV